MTAGKGRIHPVSAFPMSIAAVSSYLDTTVLGSTMAVIKEIDSTNTYIKKRISVLDDGFTVLSERQYAGRGRLGRKFVSPEGGLYMSTLLIGRDFIENTGALTVRAAVAVKNALKEITGLHDIGIKWVNDIYCDNKKVCGILAESMVRKGLCDFSVLGIGVNVTTPKSSFDSEVSEIAGSLSDFVNIGFSKNELAACILNHLEKTLFEKDKRKATAILDDYRDSSVIIGREVLVIKGDISVRAKVLGIDDDASLYVQYEDGRTEILRTGEVSTKLIGKEKVDE